MAKHILVTGGNAGIGLALCKQLAVDHGCHVYLCSRNAARGTEAVSSIKALVPEAKVELLEIDVGNDDSVATASQELKKRLGPQTLYAIVNNAGVGLAYKANVDEVLNVNLYGVKRVTEAFMPMLQQNGGRIVNVSSGAGPSYVKIAPDNIKKVLCSFDSTWDEIVNVAETGLEYDTYQGYGLSKACCTAYTMLISKKYPNLVISALTPGFIATKLTQGFGATKTPEEGTLTLKKCILENLPGSGWYWGSDGQRSPLHFMRSPGEPVYDGVLPPECQ